MLMGNLMKGVGEQAPQCMLFAGDISQKGMILAELGNHLGRLQQAIESSGLRISRPFQWGRRNRVEKSSSVVSQ